MASAPPYTGGTEFTLTTAQTAPYSQGSSTGYDVVANRLGPARRNAALNRTNATLRDTKYFANLFIQAISMDFQLAGTTAQARLTRDFYPHNVVQPAIMIFGQCIDQDQYGTLCEYIHQTQRRAVLEDMVTQLEIPGTNNALNAKLQPIMRGGHLPLVATGYINSMMRSHQQFEPAPSFNFSFTIATMYNGLFQEDPVSNQAQQSWSDILKGLQIYNPTPTTVPTVSAKVGTGAVKGVENALAAIAQGL